MRTNLSILNPYIRGLLAREILGHRKVYWITCKSGREFTNDIGWSYFMKVQSATAFASRVDRHLRLHQQSVILGDPSPRITDC